MRRLLLALPAATLLLAAPANATTVSQVSKPYVEPADVPLEESCSRYAQCPTGVRETALTAAPGESNTVVVQLSATALVFADATAPITAGAGCTAQPDGSASCPLPASTELSTLTLTLGDGDDRATLSGMLGAAISGGAGDDTLRGGAGIDVIDGGAGRDTISGGGGDDTLRGGGGADDIRGGAGDDTIAARDGMRDKVSGGRGRDTARADKRDRLRSIEVARVRSS